MLYIMLVNCSCLMLISTRNYLVKFQLRKKHILFRQMNISTTFQKASEVRRVKNTKKKFGQNFESQRSSRKSSKNSPTYRACVKVWKLKSKNASLSIYSTESWIAKKTEKISRKICDFNKELSVKIYVTTVSNWGKMHQSQKNAFVEEERDVNGLEMHKQNV